MNRKSRQVVFVCCGLVSGVIVSNTIEAETLEEAQKKFEKENKVKAEGCHGPFYVKKIPIKEECNNVQFLGESRKAIYNNWYVTALLTSEPPNCAYLLFDRRVDGKKMPRPNGTIIVKKDYLEEIK